MAGTIGYAVVGLGHIAQTQMLPAFAHARRARPVALVSSDEEKRRKLGESYGIRRLYGYDEYDACLADDDVDAVYIALPNNLHREYAERAARAGVHVLVEKPMALTEEDCLAMIAACEEAGVKLMVAYRLHFEEANLRAIEWVRKGRLGDPRAFHSVFGYQVVRGNIRTSAELGGGPTWDLGVYCVNASRQLFGCEPEEVFAWTTTGRGDERFSGVEESCTALLRFPQERVASFTCSFGVTPVASWRLLGTQAQLHMDNAYEYEAERRLLLIEDGDVADAHVGPVGDQFAPQLDYFAGCIAEELAPEPSGEEGLADVRVVEAIFRSARERWPVRLEPYRRERRPMPEQAYRMPPPAENPPTVGVEAPSAD